MATDRLLYVQPLQSSEPRAALEIGVHFPLADARPLCCKIYQYSCDTSKKLKLEDDQLAILSASTPR